MRFLRWSQAVLAYEARVPLHVVRSLAAGKLPPFLDLYEIARKLKVSHQYLAGLTDDPSQEIFALVYDREDLELLDKIRHLSKSDRQNVERVIDALATSAASPRLNDGRAGVFDWDG